MTEPCIHSGVTDVLEEKHPLAHETVYCDGCKTSLLHHVINENMITWVEAPKGNYCLPCFTRIDEAEGIEGWYAAPADAVYAPEQADD